MVLYTEAQLDMAWQQDCKNRARKEKQSQVWMKSLNII
jgi:hypothetical protein